MKKPGLFILSLFLIGFILISCTKEEVTTSTTSSLQCEITNGVFEDGLLSYDTSQICDEVNIVITNTVSKVSTSFEDTTLNFNYFLENGSYSYVLYGYTMIEAVLTLTTTFEGDEFVISNSLKSNVLDNESLNNESYIRYLGRTNYNDDLQTRTMYYAGSGFEVGFYGTELTVTLLASNVNLKTQPYFTVFIDGETNPNDGVIWFLFQSESTYQLASDLEEGYHTLRLVKTSEASDSSISLKELTTDGVFMNPSSEKTLKIEFIGDSTMTGYGDLALKPSESKTTENSSVLWDYTYLTSYYLDAEYSIIASSGWGITRGYNTSGVINLVRNMPNAYHYTGITDQSLVTLDLPWDSSESSEPDIIVISLGSNDYASSGYSSMGSEEQAAFDADFKINYKNFISHVHEIHPGAIIILVFGILSEDLVFVNQIEEIVNSNTDENLKLYAFQFTQNDESLYPYGSDYHPTVGAYLVAAKELADFIESITDYQIVHEEITKE